MKTVCVIIGPDDECIGIWSRCYSNPLNYKSLDHGTSVTSVINSTTIVMIGKHTVVCFNIETNRWTDYPDFPYPIYTSWDVPEMLSIIVNSHKNRKRYAFTEKVSKFQDLDVILVFFFSDHWTFFCNLVSEAEGHYEHIIELFVIKTSFYRFKKSMPKVFIQPR